MSKRLKVLIVIAAVVALFLGISYWYLIMCEGSWGGVPLEDEMVEELPAFEREIRADVSYLSEIVGPRNPAHYESLVATAEWIEGRWMSQGYEVKRQAFLVEEKECANLEIALPGTRKPDEIIVVCAQYDTWPDSPGANNNGGGVAVLLKLAELLRGAVADRTIRLVAFTTQEPPYDNTESMGSLRYARRCRERGEDIHLVLCMDAIGIYKQEPGTQKLPFPFSLFYPDRGDFLAFISDLESRPGLIEATRGFKKGSAFPIAAGCAPRWVKGVTWSDHYSFWRCGYRGIQITDTGAFRSASHTTSDDTMEKMDFAALARIAVGMYTATLECATTSGS